VKYSEEEKKLFSLAQARSRSGDFQSAAQLFRELVRRRPESAVFSATLAKALRSQGDIVEAEHYFKTAVSLAPRSEMFSLSLFHCLWDQGKREQALEEMRRFIRLRESEEYRTILDAILKAD
jgi:predicted Zn-dependent protease